MEDNSGNLIVRVPALEALISNGALTTSGGGGGGGGSDAALDAIISNGALTTADKNLAALILSGALKVSDTALDALISAGALKVSDANLEALISSGSLKVSDALLEGVLVTDPGHVSKLASLQYVQANGDGVRVLRVSDVNSVVNMTTASGSTAIVTPNGTWCPIVSAIQVSTSNSMIANGFLTVSTSTGATIMAWLCAAGSQQLTTPPGFYYRGPSGSGLNISGTSGIQIFVNVFFCWGTAL